MLQKGANGRPSLKEALAGIFSERVLHLSTVDRTVKWAVYLSGAILVLNAALIAAYDTVAGPRIELATGLGLRQGAIILGGVFGLLAVTVILSGLFTSQSQIRLWVTGIIAAAYLYLTAPAYVLSMGLPWGLVSALFLCGVPITFLAVLPIVARRMRLLGLSASVAMALYAMGLGYIVASAEANLRFVPDLMVLILGMGVLVAYPLFLTAAADFAELGDAISEAFGRVLFRYWPAAGLALALLVVVAANGWSFVHRAYSIEAGFADIAEYVAKGMALVLLSAFLAFALRRRSVATHHIRIPTIVGVSSALALLVAVSTAYREDRPPPVFNHSLDPEFSTLLPDGWSGEVHSETKWQPIATAVVFKEKGTLPIVTLVSIERNRVEPIVSVNQLMIGGQRLPETPMPEPSPADAQGWSRFETTIHHPPDSPADNPLHVVGWKRTHENQFSSPLNRDWYVVGVVRQTGLAEHLPHFESIRDSFMATTRDRPSQRARSVLLVGFAALAAAAAAFAAAGRGSSRLRGEAVFVTLVFGFAAIGGVGVNPETDLFGDLFMSEVLLMTVMFAVAASSALFALYAAAARGARFKRDFAALLSLNLSILLVAGVFYSFRAMTELGNEYDWLKAVIALGTLAWDIFVSGGAFTNRNSPAFPQASRILIHFGFAQFVTAATFVFFPGTMRGNAMLGFEPEAWVAAGAVSVGIPLVLTVWCLRLSGPKDGAPVHP